MYNDTVSRSLAVGLGGGVDVETADHSPFTIAALMTRVAKTCARVTSPSTDGTYTIPMAAPRSRGGTPV